VPLSADLSDRPSRLWRLLAALGGTLLVIAGICIGAEPPAIGSPREQGPTGADLAFLEYV
jgi:hypothetical protein